MHLAKKLKIQMAHLTLIDFQVNNQKKIITTIGKSLNPKWDEYFIFDLNSYYDDLNIDYMDYDRPKKDDTIGNAKIEIESLIIGQKIL